MGIIEIDMHIRDERVLEYMRQRGSRVEVKQEEIAAQFKCHRETVSRIMRRLQGAGHIRIISRPKKLGYAYEVL